jgi:hypothetical protein
VIEGGIASSVRFHNRIDENWAIIRHRNAALADRLADGDLQDARQLL